MESIKAMNQKINEDYIKHLEKPLIVEDRVSDGQKSKDNSRCTSCGFIRYARITAIKGKACPNCKSRDHWVASHEAPQEAINLFCEALRVTPMSPAGQKVKQAVEVLTLYL